LIKWTLHKMPFKMGLACLLGGSPG